MPTPTRDDNWFRTTGLATGVASHGRVLDCSYCAPKPPGPVLRFVFTPQEAEFPELGPGIGVAWGGVFSPEDVGTISPSPSPAGILAYASGFMPGESAIVGIFAPSVGGLAPCGFERPNAELRIFRGGTQVATAPGATIGIGVAFFAVGDVPVFEPGVEYVAEIYALHCPAHETQPDWGEGEVWLHFRAGTSVSGAVGIGDGFGQMLGAPPQNLLHPYIEFYTPNGSSQIVVNFEFADGAEEPVTWACPGGGTCRPANEPAHRADALIYTSAGDPTDFYPWVGIDPVLNRLNFTASYLNTSTLAMVDGEDYWMRITFRDGTPPCCP